MIYTWSELQIPDGLEGVRAMLWHRPTDDLLRTAERLAARDGGGGQDALFLRHVEQHTPTITDGRPLEQRLVLGANLEGVYDSWCRQFVAMLRGGCRGVKHLVCEYEGRVGVGYWAQSANGKIASALSLLNKAQDYAKFAGVHFALAGFDTSKMSDKAHTLPLAYAWEQLVHDHTMAYLREIARAYEFVFGHECPISNYQASAFAIEDLNGHPMPTGVPGVISAPRGYLDSARIDRYSQAERLSSQMKASGKRGDLWWCSGTFRGDRHPIETQYGWPEDADAVLAEAVAAHCDDLILWTGAFQRKYASRHARLRQMEHAATALYAAAMKGVGES